MRYKLLAIALMSGISSLANAQYNPVKGDVINTEIESTFANLLDGSDKNPVPMILKVNSIRFMGYDTDYQFKTYKCKLIAQASLPSSDEFDVRNKKAYLRIDSLVCHKKMKNRDKYVITEDLKGWGLKDKVIGVSLNKNNGLDVGDKIEFFVNKEGNTTIIYRKKGSDLDLEAQAQADKIKQ